MYFQSPFSEEMKGRLHLVDSSPNRDKEKQQREKILNNEKKETNIVSVATQSINKTSHLIVSQADVKVR